MSAQSLIGYIIMVVFSGIIFGCCGFVVGNVIIPWGNTFLNGMFMVSQDSYNTAFLLLQIFIASPIIALFLWGYDHLNNSNRQSGGDS